MPAHGTTIRAGNHHIQDNEIVGGRTGPVQRCLTVGRDVGGEELFRQAFLDKASELRFVFDDEDSHR